MTSLRLLIAAVAVATFAACGGGDDTGGADPTATTTGTDSTANVAIEASEYQFTPATLEVASGTTVTLSNAGEEPHTFTADDKSFDTGTIEPGAEKTQTFETAGTFPYTCVIHPDMKGTITVS